MPELNVEFRYLYLCKCWTRWLFYLFTFIFMNVDVQNAFNLFASNSCNVCVIIRRSNRDAMYETYHVENVKALHVCVRYHVDIERGIKGRPRAEARRLRSVWNGTCAITSHHRFGSGLENPVSRSFHPQWNCSPLGKSREPTADSQDAAKWNDQTDINFTCRGLGDVIPIVSFMSQISARIFTRLIVSARSLINNLNYESQHY